MAKGYLLGQITINDKDQYKKYDSKIGDIIEEFGGKYLIKGGFRGHLSYLSANNLKNNLPRYLLRPMSSTIEHNRSIVSRQLGINNFS